MEINEKLGKLLNVGWTCADLANEIGVAKSSISRWLNKECTPRYSRFIERINKIFKDEFEYDDMRYEVVKLSNRVSPIRRVIFKELGYYRTEIRIEAEGFEVEFCLHEKSIDDIVDVLKKFCFGFGFAFTSLTFVASSELLTRINRKTLSSTKTVYDMFVDAGIVIDKM